MTRTQKIIGASVVSILLLSLSLFSMCGVRMQRMGTEDDLLLSDVVDDGEQDDIFDQMEFMDDSDGADASEPGHDLEFVDPSSNASDEFADDGNEFGDDFSLDFEGELEDYEFDDAANGDETIADDTAELADLLDDTEDAPEVTPAEEEFLTPELVNSLQAEINDLERLYEMKQRAADSLKSQSREVEFQKVADDGVRQTEELSSQPLFRDEIAAPATTSTGLDLSSEFALYYQDALDEFYARRYDRAITKFRDLLMRSDAGDLADNCQYWIGESYYAQGKYLMAVVEFEKVYAYANSNKLSDAQLMVGIALYKMGDNQQAETQFSTLLSFHNSGDAAQKARHFLDLLQRA